jgi:ribosome biogenesis protein Nip4
MEPRNKDLLELKSFLNRLKIAPEILGELGVLIKKSRFLFAASSELHNFMKEMSTDFFSIGTPLGETKRDFIPTPELVDFLSHHSDRKVFIGPKSEWMFLCGKDIFRKGIANNTLEKNRGRVFIFNKYEENLGIAKFMENRDVPLQHIMDKGAYVRKEI